MNTPTTLSELLADSAYSDLLAMTDEQQAIQDSLFDVSRYKGQDSQSLDDSWQLLHGCKAQSPLIIPALQVETEYFYFGLNAF